MSTSTIESVETFLLDYGHKEGHHILNDDEIDPSYFVWDNQTMTGSLNVVLRCESPQALDQVPMAWNGVDAWTGSYCEAGMTFTLKISGFSYCPDTGEIAGILQRSHPEEDCPAAAEIAGDAPRRHGSKIYGGDDMGSFTGTKT